MAMRAVMVRSSLATSVMVVATCLWYGAAQAQSFGFSQPLQDRSAAPGVAAETGEEDAALDPRLRRQVVAYPTDEAPGTIIIDTPHTYLYFVLGNGRAIRSAHAHSISAAPPIGSTAPMIRAPSASTYRVGASASPMRT